jgi:DNA-binding response OmpR family regulator
VVVEAAAAGFVVDDVLAKPLDGEALVASLERLGISRSDAPRVLVVDDDGPSLRLMDATLRQLGYLPDCCPSAEAGLVAVARSAPAAVILDLLMPGMDGFEFLERFRSDASHLAIPVLVWTSKDLSDDDIVRLEGAANGVIRKGSHSELVATLQARLQPVRREEL